MPPRTEVETLVALNDYIADGNQLSRAVVTGADLTAWAIPIDLDLTGGIFLGCELTEALAYQLIHGTALVFPAVAGLPFKPWRTTLYTAAELHPQNASPVDAEIYEWWKEKRSGDPYSALLQRIHDMSIDDALNDLLQGHRVVGVMGGSSMERGTPDYLNVVHLGWAIARAGFVVVTGGGPGAMEAANLGARLTRLPKQALQYVTWMLGDAPAAAQSRPEGQARALALADWIEQMDARLVVAAPPTVGVPTWFYGHEPTNPFANHIAKYFQNSVREDGLVTLANAGIVFAPGKAGTLQEIFQDATQNYYPTNDAPEVPMILFGSRYWTHELAAWPLLQQLFAKRRAPQSDRPLPNLIATMDDIQMIVAALDGRSAPLSAAS